MEKDKTVCFTGHRPEKLPGGNEPDCAFIQMLKSMLEYHILLAVQEGYRYFISGLARGVDLWAAEMILELKKKNSDIKLIGAIPFPEQSNSFRGTDLWTYNNVVQKADKVVCISGAYSRDCYKLRNYFMVEHSSYLIGVVSNYRSGTGQTIKYAKKQGLKLAVIDANEMAKVFGFHKKNLKESFG